MSISSGRLLSLASHITLRLKAGRFYAFVGMVLMKKRLEKRFDDSTR